MNKKALYNLTYGLFVLTAKDGEVDNGCIINTSIQASTSPETISICVNKSNFTHDLIVKTKKFNISIISVDATFDLFKHFGFQSGKDVNKFLDYSDAKRSLNGIYYITKGINSYISLEVTEVYDLGSHSMFIGTISDMEIISNSPSMTYGYYFENVKPKPEVIANNSGKTVWRCEICGYEYVGEELPDDFICPICKHPKSNFVKISVNTESNINEGENKTMAKWVCPVCGYVHEGDAAPEKCPVCKVPGEKFTKVEGELKLAAEHKFGIYEKTVKNNPNISESDKAYILEQLKANFAGECSEVGMYLCMARIAHREGYPEIGLYWEKAAFEEAEHAAKFAELLGSECEPKMTASTKDNLAWRVDCEFGATQGKFDLALCAKKNGLDEIHDTVHEMARDEARHGKALKGLLERHFK